MSRSKRCVLAYSGGLDTSAIVPWLVDQGYEVHAVLVDVGQAEDISAYCEKATALGAESVVVRDAKPAMFESVIPMCIALGATYEREYRLGTAIARPFIALEQVRRAKELGADTLAHGATGKGNDQVRFEFAYRALAPQCSVLAPWKVWDFRGRRDLIAFLKSKGAPFDFAVEKTYSLDENLWHLSVEGGPLEKPSAMVDIEEVLADLAHRFGGERPKPRAGDTISIGFDCGVPVAVDGKPASLPEILGMLNARFRNAPWAWDLIIENRTTGVKSRGLYVNPAAKLLHLAVDALARSSLNKPSYDQYFELGRSYGEMLYRGEYFSDQRLALEAAARSLIRRLGGEVRVCLTPAPYVCQIQAESSLFCEELATFERSAFSHSDAGGFIQLSWLSRIGRTQAEGDHEDHVEGRSAAASELRGREPVASAGLVSPGV